MLRFFIQPALTLTALLTVIIVLLRVTIGVTTPAPLPFDVFTYPGCNGPCWQGLAVGQSEPSELRAVLNRLGVEAVTMGSFDGQLFAVDLSKLNDEQLYGIDSFVVPRGVGRPNRTTVETNFSLGVLDSVEARAGVCMDAIFLTYGLPDNVYFSIFDGGSFYAVYYYGEAVVVFTSSDGKRNLARAGMFLAEDNRNSSMTPFHLPWSEAAGHFRNMPCEES